ncbi:MAG TPA: type II toxin-antitoxin system RelE/ParE family toxin [Burkholderiales bacterium]
MAAYRLLIKPSAGKELEAVGTRSDRLRIVQRIHALAEDPRPSGSEKLAGYDDRYRIRQGHYRVVYLIDDKQREITVYRIGHRRDVYR